MKYHNQQSDKNDLLWIKQIELQIIDVIVIWLNISDMFNKTFETLTLKCISAEIDAKSHQMLPFD